MRILAENPVLDGPLLAPFDSSKPGGRALDYPSLEFAPDFTRLPYSPKGMLLQLAEATERPIEGLWWAKPIQLDFDLPEGSGLSPVNQRFKQMLTASLGKQIIKGERHGTPGLPSDASDMVLGFTDLPTGDAPLWDRIQEIPPKIKVASKKYGVKDLLHKNYTIVVNTPDDLTTLKKRNMERHVRRAMASLGAIKLVFVNDQGQASFATLEGGLGTNNIVNDPKGIHAFRDRLVTSACAIESGSYQLIKDVISSEDAALSKMPDYIAQVLKNFGDWGFIDPPFDISSVVSKDRTNLATALLGYGRQAESAASAQDLEIVAPVGYEMEDASGLIRSTVSGRDQLNIDKRNLGRDGSMYVSIVPRSDWNREGDPLNLYSFDRYALGAVGEKERKPSIEFDEMASVYRNSPSFGVSPIYVDGALVGYREDENGSLRMKRVRGFVHFHGMINMINSVDINGRNAQDMIEYIKPNLEEYGLPVGCGKNIQFAASTDAALRSKGVQNHRSGIHVAFFDAINHGTHVLALAEPIPGTDIYPADPFYMVSQLFNPANGVLSVTEEIAQI